MNGNHRRDMSDAEFLEWIRHQPSCITAQFGEFVDSTDEGLNDACHVRRAGPANVGLKPKYSAVPMTHEQHDLQTRKGELACLLRFLPDTDGEPICGS
jgi:hypothetical protein